MPPVQITAEQWRAYEADGVVRVPSAISPEATAEMADRLWAFLAESHGFHRGRPETWTAEWPSHFQPLSRGGAFKPMGSPMVRAAADRLLGPGRWIEPDPWGQPLVTAPRAMREGWQVPRQMWHLDHAPGLPAYTRIFAFLEDVRPQGGGTAYVRGSHHLVAALAEAGGLKLKSAEVKARLSAHPWFAELWSKAPGGDRIGRFMEEGAVIDGISVAVREMTGAAGDVILMHPLMLHTKAPNVLDSPRLMLTQWIYAAA